MTCPGCFRLPSRIEKPAAWVSEKPGSHEGVFNIAIQAGLQPRNAPVRQVVDLEVALGVEDKVEGREILFSINNTKSN